MSPTYSCFATLYSLNFHPHRLGLRKPTIATIFKCLAKREETHQSDSTSAKSRSSLAPSPRHALPCIHA
ncbi:hypothetical protein, partial [Merismopedia glauca]|uniref:hypothetical protein n=1 Tax=Merismopedia glauca TaxID=292586 RepID=UPI001C62DC2C